MPVTLDEVYLMTCTDRLLYRKWLAQITRGHHVQWWGWVGWGWVGVGGVDRTYDVSVIHDAYMMGRGTRVRQCSCYNECCQ